MTRKEKIKAILDEYDNYDDFIIGGNVSDEVIEKLAALPIDVPSTLELLNAKRAYPMKKYPYSNISDLMANADRINTAGEGFGEGATWMRDEIIKRNRP